MLTDIFSASAAIFYGLSLFLVLRNLFAHAQISEKLVFFSAGIAVACHTVALATSIIASDGQNMSILAVASIVSWIIAAMLTIALPRFSIAALLPVVYGFALFAVVGLWLVPSSYITHFETHPEVLIHICLALSAYSTLVIAAFYAIQLYIIDKRLKSKQLNLANSPLPPLLTVEKQLFQLILAGIILLTISLATGFFFLEDMFAQGKAHKAILSLCAWLLYTYLLWRHYDRGVRIQMAVQFTISGAILLTLAYFGSRLVSEILVN